MKLIYYYDISSSSSSSNSSSSSSGGGGSGGSSHSDNSDSTSVVQPATLRTPHNMYSNLVNKYAYELNPGDNVLVLIPTIGGYNGPLFEMRFHQAQAYLIDTKPYNLCMWIKNISHDTTLHIGPKTSLLTVLHQLEIDYMISYIACAEMWNAINFFYPATEPSTLPPPPSAAAAAAATPLPETTTAPAAAAAGTAAAAAAAAAAGSSLAPSMVYVISDKEEEEREDEEEDEEELPEARAAAAAAAAIVSANQAAKIRKGLNRNFSNWGYNYDCDEEYYECMDDVNGYRTKEY
jgi:pyruvate/2-oxoglutarate dehydrogenase complex dihydrolipoamide acyltransferase (E2) component